MDKEYTAPDMDTARVIQVIETTTFRRGTGEEDSPLRMVTQYFSMDGELLAEVDPLHDTRGIPPHEKGHWTHDRNQDRRRCLSTERNP